MIGTYSLNPDVVFRRLDDRMVLVHLKTNQIYELNETGARVWELLEGGTNPIDLGPHLSTEFEVDTQSLENEIQGLLNDLETEGLITK